MPERTLCFVTSTTPQARLAHLGSGPSAACGVYLLLGHRVVADMPVDRAMCRRCAAVAVAEGRLAAVEADVLLAHVPVPTGWHELVTLLREGSDIAAARTLGVSGRTVHRRVHAAMRDMDARTRFDFGYRVAEREVAGDA